MNALKEGVLILERESGNFLYHLGYSYISNGDLAKAFNLEYWLNIYEINKISSFKYPLRKESYLLGRLSAKKAILQLDKNINPKNIIIKNGVFGFPIVEGLSNNIQVVYSHCREKVICVAFEEAFPVGVDLEEINQNKTTLLKKKFTENELVLIKQNSIDEYGFILTWTIKEALSKIIKTGLTLDLKILELSSIEKKHENIFESHFVNFSQYKSVSFILKDHICSIVIPKKSFFEYESFFKVLSE